VARSPSFAAMNSTNSTIPQPQRRPARRTGAEKTTGSLQSSGTGLRRNRHPPRRRKLHPYRAPASHPAHPAIDPPGACLDPPTRSLARFHRPPEASLAHKISLVFHTDLADCYRAGTHGIYSAQRKAHPPLGAGAEVDHGVEVVVAKNHRTRTAPSGWMVRPVRFYFYFGICSSFNIVNPE
jgi:hypothetical protein